ncbi:hypothetical protein SAMN05216233_109162 [Desulfoluna spongiiphila]|uniref:Uncharacterized protein n=1 Tax=Desulfoluna spongiiphila TaxID=419481 RepID=A0A1G5G263_9BACT|nr:hypothetical protein SAMN05216233_109162 [Desulfoluna spongiiphila]
MEQDPWDKDRKPAGEPALAHVTIKWTRRREEGPDSVAPVLKGDAVRAVVARVVAAVADAVAGEGDAEVAWEPALAATRCLRHPNRPLLTNPNLAMHQEEPASWCVEQPPW